MKRKIFNQIVDLLKKAAKELPASDYISLLEDLKKDLESRGLTKK